MIKTDFLLRIVDKAIVDDVFNNGRKFFEVIPPPGERYSGYSYMRVQPGDMPTMPIDFSVAAYRLGHSMIRGAYQWNRVFRDSRIATLLLLFTFSGTSGILSPDGNIDDPESGSFERLPTNWIADFRRLFDFGEAGRDDLRVQPAEFNITKRIDTLLGGERRNLLDINQLAPGLTISPGMVRPPEAGMQAPVSQPASSEARKTGLDSNRIPAQSRIVILNLF